MKTKPEMCQTTEKGNYKTICGIYSSTNLKGHRMPKVERKNILSLKKKIKHITIS
jgi:hypothetical protein